MIKKRKAKNSPRGIYIQDKELRQTCFQPGTHFRYILDEKEKKVTIVTSNEGRNTVSKRQLKDGVKPVIDIRSTEVLAQFIGCDALEVEIFNDEIVVTGLHANVVCLEEKRFERGASIHMSIAELRSVSGGFSIFKPISRVLKELRKVASLFSGAGIMDLGFVQEGFTLDFAIEKDPEAAETYEQNIGDHIHCGDLSTFDLSYVPNSAVMIGGPPCKPFSNANRVKRALDHPDSFLINRFIQAIKQNKHCKVFVLENVPQLLTSLGGRFRDEILHELRDFSISYGVMNAAEFGTAQLRKRAIFIGSKIGKIPLPKGWVQRFKTVKEAFCGLSSTTPNQLDYSQSKAATIERMTHIPQGGNVFDIPIDIRPKGTHSDFYKRLSMNQPSVTIVNPRKSMLLHPIKNRILSIRECARLFDVPDSFVFKGKLNAMQQQIANAVPVSLSQAIASYIMMAMS